MSRVCRVLHLVWDFSAGGLERLVHDLALHVDASRFETHILTLRGARQFSGEVASRATLHTARPMTRLSLLYPRALSSQIREIGPDVVHSHSGVWHKSATAARIARVPAVVHTDHGRLPGMSRLDQVLERFAARRTDLVVCVSRWVCDYYRSELGLPPDRVRFLTNGIDTERFRPRAGKTGDLLGGRSADRAIIGSVGRLDLIKGYDVMIDALALHVRGGGRPEVQLVLVGDGPQRSILEAQARRLGLTERVSFLGWRSDVEAVLPELDLFCLSSRSEGTSLSLLEAMSCGTVPVVTDVGGNADVLGPSLRHRLVPAEDPARLAAAWTSALGDPEALRADAELGRERVKESFDVRTMTVEYERIYQSLVGDAS